MEKIYLFRSVLILTYALIGISSAQSNETCTRHESLTPVEGFEVERMMGKWIGFKRFVGNSEDVRPSNITCYDADFRREPGLPEVFIRESWRDGNGDGPFSATSLAVTDHEEEALWRIYFVEGDFVHVNNAVYVHTDYDNWALQYTCANSKAGTRHESMIIWTRTSTPDPQVIELLEILVQNYGFSLENEIPPDQNECP